MILLDQRHPPTAVFCHNDLLAVAALNAARALGVRVPEDLSVVGFDNTRLAGWESLSLTTVSQPLSQLASRSVELLQARMADPDLPARHEMFPSSLIHRRTTDQRRVRPRPEGRH